jgi:hypothetical protein
MKSRTVAAVAGLGLLATLPSSEYEENFVPFRRV